MWIFDKLRWFFRIQILIQWQSIQNITRTWTKLSVAASEVWINLTFRLNKIIYRTNHFKKVLKRLWKIFVDVFQYRVHCKNCNIVRANAPSMVYIFHHRNYDFKWSACNYFLKRWKHFLFQRQKSKTGKRSHCNLFVDISLPSFTLKPHFISRTEFCAGDIFCFAIKYFERCLWLCVRFCRKKIVCA